MNKYEGLYILFFITGFISFVFVLTSLINNVLAYVMAVCYAVSFFMAGFSLIKYKREGGN